MGLFKGMKDLASLTKQAKELQDNQQQQAGYKPGMGGAFQQMGDMIGDANEQLSELNQMGGAQSGLLATGTPGEGIVVGHGVPARGAQWFNMDIDMEIHVSGRAPYRVNNMYMVPASATIGAGVKLPVKVDQSDPSKIAIDWSAAQTAPAHGEVRPSGGGVTASAAPTQGAAPAAPGGAGGGDSVAELERLAKLRDSGALTEAEFQQQKARILGS
jgi:hypothetical protein